MKLGVKITLLTGGPLRWWLRKERLINILSGWRQGKNVNKQSGKLINAIQ